MDQACLELWIAMFDHELKAGDMESGMMSGLAVLGLDNDNQKQQWKHAINYPPIWSAIVTVMRALVIQQAWVHREEEMQRLRNER